MGVSVPVGAEAWKNCSAGLVYVTYYDSMGREKTRAIKGGEVLRMTADARRIVQESVTDPAKDIFTNGTLKRVDNRIAPAEPSGDDAILGEHVEIPVADGKTALPEGYEAEKALDGEDLLALLDKKGNAFQSAVKKLSEGQARRLMSAMNDPENADNVAASQQNFLSKYLAENFAHGKTAASYLEIQGERLRSS